MGQLGLLQNQWGMSAQVLKMCVFIAVGAFECKVLMFTSTDYIIVTPVEVDSDGAYLTHDIGRRIHRSRRSLSSSLHYSFSAFGQDLHLDLRPSSVVGPGFTVQTLGSGGISTVTGDAGFRNCLYQGFIRNLSESSAAISTCSGLVRVLSQSPLLLSYFLQYPAQTSKAGALTVHNYWTE